MPVEDDATSLTASSPTSGTSTPATPPASSDPAIAGPPVQPSSTIADLTGSLEIRADVVPEPEQFAIRTQGPFAVWWDPDFPEIEETIPKLFALLAEVEADATEELGFGPLPTIDEGQYLNVYVHVPEEDRFPDFLGNGLGYSEEGMPYVSMPVGAHTDETNVRHEAFHMFQSTSDYAAIDEDLDALWFIEASAEWYQHTLSDDDPRSFITAGSMYATPHLALWHVPENAAPGDPEDNDWLYGVRQYSAGSFLYYLTERGGVDRSTVAEVWTTEPDTTAQEYLFRALGGDSLGEVFADFAVRAAAGLEFLTEEQAELAIDELEAFAAPDEIRAHVVELTDPDEVTFSPPPESAPRSWAYNSILVENTDAATYTVELAANPTGSEGASARFEARVAIRNRSDDVRYLVVPMAGGTEGRLTFDVGADDTELYLVVASVPENLDGNEHFSYDVTISAN